MAKIEAHHLHAIADVVGGMGDHTDLGFAENALEEFVEKASFLSAEGARVEVDELSLALGVSIGVLAGTQLAEHEQDHTP